MSQCFGIVASNSTICQTSAVKGPRPLTQVRPDSLIKLIAQIDFSTDTLFYDQR